MKATADDAFHQSPNSTPRDQWAVSIGFYFYCRKEATLVGKGQCCPWYLKLIGKTIDSDRASH
jgi:hypothetical protein